MDEEMFEKLHAAILSALQSMTFEELKQLQKDFADGIIIETNA